MNKVMKYLIPTIIKFPIIHMCACFSFTFHSFLFLSLFLFRSNANDENHEYLAPVNDENTNIARGATGLVVRDDVENPKEI